jgi:phage terminase small subunit
MPVLKHPKRERFAQEFAKGKTQLQAYEDAGYKPSEGNAGTLARRPEVAERIAEITSRGARRAEVTVESICRELDEARTLARKLNQASPMVSATLGKAKVARLLDEVVKHTGADGGAIKHSIEVRFVDSETEE